MDIWQWVRKRYDTLYDTGKGDLADLIYEIPSYVTDDEFEKVDQLVEQALPLARQIEDKWLEVYLRHWRLQSHVLRHYDANGHLSEAVALLDFSHQPETEGCPQRICAVQDLAACYGIKDGPGFVEERIAVTKETLAQIDASWPCYECINSELISALLDGNRIDEALEQISFVKKELAKVEENDGSEMIFSHTNTLIAAQQFDEAWTLIRDAKNQGGGKDFERKQRLMKALVCCFQSRWEEAVSFCPPYEEAKIAASHFDEWTMVKTMLVHQGIIKNDEILRFQFHWMAVDLINKDANRKAFSVLHRLGELCLAVGARLRAKIALKMMSVVVQRLNKDLGAKDTLNALQKQVSVIDDAEDLPNFQEISQLIDYEFKSVDDEYHALIEAQKRWPDQPDIIIRISQILSNNFQESEAYILLENAWLSQPSHALLEDEYGKAYFAKHGFNQYQDAFPLKKLEGLSDGAIWNRGFFHAEHLEQLDTQAALRAYKIVEKYWQDNVFLIGKIAHLEIKSGKFTEAIKRRKQQVELEPEEDNHKWDLLIAATLAGEKQTVCTMANILGMQVTEEGTFLEAEQGYMRLEMALPDGTTRNFRAIRTGPALCRITTINDIEEDYQFYDCEVVFDPLPLNKLDQTDADGDPCDSEGYNTLLYPAIHTITAPVYQIFPLDGLYPGEEVLNDLHQQIIQAGFIYNRRSGEEYQLVWDEAEEEKVAQGVYIYVLLTSDQDPKTLDRLLSRFCRKLDTPLLWTSLLATLGKSKELAEQTKLADHYGLE